MERKQGGFYSTLRSDFVRGLSPSRTRLRSRSVSPIHGFPPISSIFPFRKKTSSSSTSAAAASVSHLDCQSEMLIGRSGSLRPVIEGPDPDEGLDHSRRTRSSLSNWVKGQFMSSSTVSRGTVFGSGSCSSKKSDIRLLLGVMGAPLAPVDVSSSDPFHHLSIKDTPIETSSAQYILQQYTAACGGQRLQSRIRNSYAMGKLRMAASEFESPTKLVKNRTASKSGESGGFVLWQMNSDMWYVELAIGNSKLHAGCNGKLVWRHTPWLGSHCSKGPVRPLRRALQGLDPKTTARMFADAKCIGEKKTEGEDCFILKLNADPDTLKTRSDGPAEIIRHVLFGYFSQKTGLLVHLEDSHLKRIQSNCGDVVYWETTINSFLNDYRPVDGIMIAHSGRSVVTLYKFGESAMSHRRTKIEESWSIDEVAFNVPGLSMDCFIPPADLRSGSVNETCCFG